MNWKSGTSVISEIVKTYTSLNPVPSESENPKSTTCFSGAEGPIIKKSSARVTGRSLLLGVLFIPINVYWMTIVEVKYYSLDGSCLPLFIQPVFIMFVCVVANCVLKRLAPRCRGWVTQPLQQGELLTIYIMVAISCTFAGHDTMQNMFGSIAHPFRFATEENEWQTLFFRYLPSWLTVSDAQSLQGFYEGEATFYTQHNFSVWLKPLMFWGLFFLIMMFMMLCINTLVRKRWAEQEKLAYPIIQLPLGLSEDGGISLLKNRMMWMGFSIAVVIGVINGVHYLFPQFPEIPYIKRTSVFQNIFTERPWSAIRGTRISIYPFAVGLAFFLPLDLSFSCWFFFVVRLAEFVIAAALGTRYFPALNEQAYGAWIALFLLAGWVTRRHLSEVFKKVLGFKSRLDDSNEPMPYRAAFLGILGSLIALGIFSSIAGMTLWVAGIFFGVYFLLSFAITRVRAELGTPHEIYYVNPHDMLATVGGTRRFDTSSLTIMSLFYWFNRGYRNHPMPNQIEAFKLAESTGMGNRRLWVAMLIAIVIGILATFWANLDITFRNGAVAKAGGFKGWVGRESFGRLQRWLHNPTEPNVIGIGFMGIGALLTFVMMYMRMHFLWWPFHPAGYALAISFAMDYFWFAFFVAWFLKLMILRHGGLRLHRKVAPLFLGLILGDYVIGSIWAIIGPVSGLRTYKIFI